MRVLQTEFLGDHNVGLFVRACDKFFLVGNQVDEKRAAAIGRTLGVGMVRSGIANTDLVGIFSVFNSNGIVIPTIATDSEVSLFRNLAARKGMNFHQCGTKFTAIGNLILCNDKGAAVSRAITAKEKKMIEDCLDVEADYATAAGIDSVGSCGIATNKGCIMHRDSSEEELDNVQRILGVETDIGTGNFGSPFLGSCATANSDGIVAGDSTTGPEITRMMETLKLL